ncbi:unnamed protein product [Protopolystoma xenopodis]|uniref:RRM domain-containing protein n=1 Tax=Protopolystoma xenopodis TaxID=117903 RepID=A0A3S5B2T1_9PLAT|nr:unnamed protein product [Protopolystoma xenopodis]
MTFSRKVFLGGVPWDSSSDDLVAAFMRFGYVSVLWPQRDGTTSSNQFGRSSSPRGMSIVHILPIVN